jgi:hypothetical protein
MNLLLRVVSVVAALLVLPAATWAQVGEIAGQARDVTGAALPGVTVVVSSRTSSKAAARPRRMRAAASAFRPLRSARTSSSSSGRASCRSPAPTSF